MATKNYTFEGQCKWAKLQEPDEKFGDFRLDLHLDEANLAEYRKAGSQGRVKDDNYVTFRRPNKRLTAKGDLMEFGKPTVTDQAGNAFTELIGNGSKVRINVSVYDTTKGPGTRLNSVVVLEHVPYSKPAGVVAPKGVNVPF